MTLDEALRKLDLAQINQIQLTVLEAAVAATLKTHPDPAAVRREFDLLYAQMHERAASVSATDAQAVSVVAKHLKNELFAAAQ